MPYVQDWIKSGYGKWVEEDIPVSKHRMNKSTPVKKKKTKKQKLFRKTVGQFN